MPRILVLSFALVAAMGSGGSAVRAAGGQQLPPGMTPAIYKLVTTPGPQHPAGLPRDVQPFGGCIPTMGYHYANPKNWPFGPIYGWYKGKPTFTEVMIDAKMFAAGKSWSEVLQPLPGYHIHHVDIWYEAHGHPGFEVPHYDVHAWYVPASSYMYFCNPSGKKPAFL